MIEQPAGHDSDKKQVISRVAAILAAIAEGGPHGVRLVELADVTGIARPTVHRMLGELRAVGYVEQLPNKRHILGQTLARVSMAAPSPKLDVIALQDIAQELSDQTGDTTYVAMRTFGATYYLVRTEGAYPVRARSVEQGELMALTASYSGLVFLAQLPPHKREEHLARAETNHPALEWSESSSSEHVEILRQTVNAYEDTGYIFGHDVVVPGISGMAMPVPVRHGKPYLVVSLSGINSRFQPERLQRLHELLSNAVAQVEQVLGEGQGNRDDRTAL